MVELKIEVPEDFYKEETVTFSNISHTITSDMKKVWAVQLDLLREFERICNKYNLRYSAYAGTLLGAVRHKGFIPWDDDIDLIMPRKDYDCLLSHSDEFEHPYLLQTPYTDSECFDYVAKLRRSDTTGAVKTDIFQDFNNGIFIDIFVLDDIPISKFGKLKKILSTKICSLSIYKKFDRIKNKSQAKKKVIKPSKSVIDKYLKKYKKLEYQCKKNTGNKLSKEMGAYQFGICFDRTVHPKNAFDNLIDMPFEFISIKIPQCYKDLLLRNFGKNYMTPIKGSSLHQGIVFSTDTPYNVFLEEYRRQYK